MFARLRIPTIFQRARFQDIILRGVRDKLLNPEVIPQLPGLIAQFSGSVLTDLSPNEINQLVCLSQKINSENTRIVAFPDNMFTSESTYDPYRNVETYTLGVDNNLMRTYLADFMDGTWPEQ
jgi:anionic cell wall polymer biosynthesis LytR-Cps2A-Psr (LCP) family protein